MSEEKPAVTSKGEVAAASATPAAEPEVVPVPVVIDAPLQFPLSARVALIGIFVIMLIGSLYLARAIVLPLVLALLITLAASPAIRWLARRGLSPAVSAIVLVAMMSTVAGIGATLLRGPISDMVAGAPQVVQAVRDRFDKISQPFDFLTKGNVAPPPAGPAGAAGQTAPAAADSATTFGSPTAVLGWLFGTLADVGSIVIATLLLAPFLMASTDTLKLKLVRVTPLLSDKKRALRVLRDVEQRVSRYLVTVSVINFTLGALIGIAMWVLGMPNPILWGVGAAFLNYVPYIGPITGIGLAAAVSLMIHPDLLPALLPPAAYAALNSLEGTVVTPLTVGRRLSLSIVAILITIGLTTWMWGVIGTIIGVPILVVVKVFCDEFPGLAQIGLFISAESEPIEEHEDVAVAAEKGITPPETELPAGRARPAA